jgi:hypothetical protein
LDEAAAEADGAEEEQGEEPEAEEEAEEELEEEELEEDSDIDVNASMKRPASDNHMISDDYMIAFNTELMLAKRYKAGQEADAELSFPLDPKGGNVDDLVQAKFLSGVFTVPGLTYRRLQSMRGERGAASAGTGKLWEQTHKATNHAIYIAQRVDRFLLLSVYEQTKQRLQIRVDRFGPVKDQHAQEPLDSETLKKALAFLTPIAQKFADNELEVKDLKAARDEKIANEAAPRSQVRARALKKRPAAARDSDAIASGDADVAHLAKQPCIEQGIAASAAPSSTASSSSSQSALRAVPKACLSNKRYVEYEELPDVEKGFLEHFLDL